MTAKKKALRRRVVRGLTTVVEQKITQAYRELGSLRTAYGALDQTRKRAMPEHFYDWDGGKLEEALALLREGTFPAPKGDWVGRVRDFIYRMSR